MKVSSSVPTVTKKWHIEVPTHKYYSNYAVYKIWFGKYFFIWKGKSMLQSAETIAVFIERACRLSGNDSAHYLYHVVGYINRARVTKAYLEIVEIADFDDKDWLKYLQIEHNLLTAHKNDPYCLNNNFSVYVPDWMGAEVKQSFETWVNSKSKPKKAILRKKDAHA